ncbi:MAG: DeoR/GlpR family DNA-binding transcription regulator [Chloroflexota bacterium]
MLPDERRQFILDRLKRDGRVIAKAISEELDLSEDTIRRDLRELADEGLLQRVHGGALPASPAIADFAKRETILPQEKVAIGRAVAGMVQPGQVVMLDGGTTAVQAARHLPVDLQATVVTHSASIAVELVEHPTVDVILIGGRLYKHSIVSVGAAALEAIRQIYADVYFMGVTGVHAEAGLTTGDYEEAKIKLALSQQAAETYVMASGEKLGAASTYLIAPLNAVTGLVVDRSVPDETLRLYQDMGLAIRQAE